MNRILLIDVNGDLFIPRCEWLIIDSIFPSIRSLTIEGVVEFQQVRSIPCSD